MLYSNSTTKKKIQEWENCSSPNDISVPQVFERLRNAAKIFSWTIYYLCQVWVCSNPSRSPCKHLKKKQKDLDSLPNSQRSSRVPSAAIFLASGMEWSMALAKRIAALRARISKDQFSLDTFGRYGNTHTLFKARVFFPFAFIIYTNDHPKKGLNKTFNPYS